MRVWRELNARISATLLLLTLPVFVLFFVGLYLVRQDRNSVETEAKEATENGARYILASFGRALTNYDAGVYIGTTNEWPSGTLFFRTSTNGDLSFPPPDDRAVRPVGSGLNLSREQSNLWAAAERAEYQRQDFDEALRSWNEVLATPIPKEKEAAARFVRAVLLERKGDTNAASRELSTLTIVSADLRLDSGLPIAPLAALKLLQRTEASPESEIINVAMLCISNLLTHPTEFTPQLLRAGRGTPVSAEFEKAERCWGQHEQARALYYALQRPSSDLMASNFFLIPASNWWILRSETNFIARSFENVRELASKFAAEVASVPPDVPFTLKLGNTQLFASSDKHLSEDRVWTSVTDPAFPGLRFNAFLEDQSALFARQRQRARVFEGLLAISALCAGVGAFQTQRSLRKQQRLSEMKSNFVSSVSHELRAPLGSVRLISEALQSGRVVDSEKQREYFNFLVDESRRLSGLIENVLEFSRIEQNRRAFQFESVDLRDICGAAVKSAAPIAGERGVNLATTGLGQNEPCEVSGDALALQRAVTNLLDNAIKHSPAGETVSLKLNRAPEHFEISVKDNGPGIPASEHKRIFERFYRLGSELRRETPGVGIGLSIVQHTIQAHGGSINLVSSPGHGATFTIRLPYARP